MNGLGLPMSGQHMNSKWPACMIDDWLIFAGWRCGKQDTSLERAAAFAGDEGGSEGGGQLGAGRETLNLKCFATLSGEAGTCASPPSVAKQALVRRHYQWRSTSRAGPAYLTWQPLPRHWQWRRTIICVATVDGEAKRGYSRKIVSPMVYFLKSFQV
jgi:hypothetical protein